MANVYLESRLDFLRKTQNEDGGWGYFPGKHSWLEPTAYASLALHGTAEADHAWTFVRGLQSGDGSWRPAGHVDDATWATAQAITLHAVRGVFDEPFRRGVSWLLATSGVESSPVHRLAALLHIGPSDREPVHAGWPWRPGNSSWIEPTVHTLLALKKAAPRYGGSIFRDRIEDGEQLIFSRRCSDGGWNYGNAHTFSVDLPSFPETTGLALLGVQDRPHRELAGALAYASSVLSRTKSPLAKAWLSLGLRSCAVDVPALGGALRGDVVLAALEALADPAGNHELLRVRSAA